MATTIKVSSARNLENLDENLTFGKGTNGGLTITGTIYEAEGYTFMATVDGLQQKVDLSDQLYKITVSITFSKRISEELKKSISEFFSERKEDGFHTLHAGLVIKCDTISGIVKGTHPKTGEETKSIVATCSKLPEIEIAPDLSNDSIEEFISTTDEARENAKARSTKSLLDYKAIKALGNNIKKGATDIATAFLTDEKTTNTKKKAKKTEKVEA